MSFRKLWLVAWRVQMDPHVSRALVKILLNPDFALFTSAAAMRFMVWAAHLACLGRLYFPCTSASLSSASWSWMGSGAGSGGESATVVGNASSTSSTNMSCLSACWDIDCNASLIASTSGLGASRTWSVGCPKSLKEEIKLAPLSVVVRTMEPWIWNFLWILFNIWAMYWPVCFSFIKLHARTHDFRTLVWGSIQWQVTPR